ncbi:hypothetical protein M405DRAFT_403847 [Rhizopogon salebrosus TDB-379]|nr:hypothetical protein M405DRAFT_403847 [Rhizopogon salebrosus TDB-379]
MRMKLNYIHIIVGLVSIGILIHLQRASRRALQWWESSSSRLLSSSSMSGASLLTGFEGIPTRYEMKELRHWYNQPNIRQCHLNMASLCSALTLTSTYYVLPTIMFYRVAPTTALPQTSYILELPPIPTFHQFPDPKFTFSHPRGTFSLSRTFAVLSRTLSHLHSTFPHPLAPSRHLAPSHTFVAPSR